MNEHVAQAASWHLLTLSDAKKRHRLSIAAFVALGTAIVIMVLVPALRYYLLDQAQRPFSIEHSRFKPSGTVGLRLGILGLLFFALVYLYPLRKHWPWLARKGKTKHWLDYHVVLGLLAPIIITLHSSLKFQGFAGMAYWTMVALTASGLVGRYFYAQIPKSLGAAEMSFKELDDLSSRLAQQLHARRAVLACDVESLFRLPNLKEVQAMPLFTALALMVSIDLLRPFKIWEVRRRASRVGSRLLTFGGVLRTHNPDFERAIRILRQQASLSKKILFLSKTERIFHLWHVVHRPFSYTFALLVAIHVTVVVLLGYF